MKKKKLTHPSLGERVHLFKHFIHNIELPKAFRTSSRVFKVTVGVIFSAPTGKDANARFTTVPLIAFADQV